MMNNNNNSFVCFINQKLFFDKLGEETRKMQINAKLQTTKICKLNTECNKEKFTMINNDNFLLVFYQRNIFCEVARRNRKLLTSKRR